MLELKEDHWYRTRGGGLVQLKRNDTNPRYPWGVKGNGTTYTNRGTEWCSDLSDYDLVEEVGVTITPVKPSVHQFFATYAAEGKLWKNPLRVRLRDGTETHICCVMPPFYTDEGKVFDTLGCSWCIDGRETGESDSGDIVEIIEE